MSTPVREFRKSLACLLATSALVLVPAFAKAQMSNAAQQAQDIANVLPIPLDAEPPATGAVAGDANAASVLQTEPKPAPAQTTAAVQSENARQYCSNITDEATDARYARQVAALKKLEEDVNGRIEALEKKRAEYEEWLKRREDFLRKAEESVVAIFTQMRPDAASQQMAVMAPAAAAAILVKLKPRSASAILNEMEPIKAAQLTTTMAGLARASDEAKNPG
ncbi:hypothetical protein L0F51_08625 [Afifella sp. H1R]|uniref:MotE family protein n=1 Tax=Afifella sp. H1R TaxID=2908841 RepID=UPI001F2E3114|nr:MotE family protein [Afifella sp. H1R]MCF1503823.1 hypothetical protein [Afifella sp. H1R]